MGRLNIKVIEERLPIPQYRWGYCAYDDNTAPDGPYGYGDTPEAAVWDLMEKMAEEAMDADYQSRFATADEERAEREREAAEMRETGADRCPAKE